MSKLAHEYGHARLAALAEQAAAAARAAFRARFWCHETDYPYDVMSEVRDHAESWADSSIRPNAVIALAIDPELFDAWQARAILDRARSELLTPRGLRTLSPNDAHYVGNFSGTSDEREMAYHQGSAWPYLLGFYVRAARAFSPEDTEVHDELRTLLESALENGALFGQVSQLADGDYPNKSRGAPAQATSVAELLRGLALELRL